MAKFLVYHTLPAGLSFEQVVEMAKGIQAHPEAKGSRSFLNLTKGKEACIWEGRDAKAVSGRLQELKIPFDDIIELEVEGEGASMQKV